VILDEEMRDDDIEVVVNAIRMIKRVDVVHTGEIQDLGAYQASSDFAQETGRLLTDVVRATCGIRYGNEHDVEFLDTIKAASEKLRRKRGY